jgi:hypothetical protein
MRHHPGETLRDAADSLELRIAPALGDDRLRSDLERVIRNLRLLEQIWDLVPGCLRSLNAALRELVARLELGGDIDNAAPDARFDAIFAEHLALNARVVVAFDLLDQPDAGSRFGIDAGETRDAMVQLVKRAVTREAAVTETDITERFLF